MTNLGKTFILVRRAYTLSAPVRDVTHTRIRCSSQDLSAGGLLRQPLQLLPLDDFLTTSCCLYGRELRGSICDPDHILRV